MSEPKLDRDDERALWQALIESDGWNVLKLIAQKSFSASATLEGIAASVTAQKPGDWQAQHEKVIQALAERRAVQALMDYPGARLKALDSDPNVESIVRRRA